MVKIICEQPFKNSLWCKQIVTGLFSELKKKRIKYTEIDDISEVQENDDVFVVGTNYIWLNNAVNFCNSLNIRPILLSNRTAEFSTGQFHSVSTDIKSAVTSIINTLHCSGKRKIALYGVNKTSVSDMKKAECYCELERENQSIFYNMGKISRCLKEFISRIDEFDAVICVNGIVAASLVKKILDTMPDKLDKLTVVSCSKSIFRKEFSDYIISVDTNYKAFGKAALVIYDSVRKNDFVSDMTITVNWTVEGKNFDLKTLPSAKKQEPRHLFYEDDEVGQMLGVEKLLDECDSAELKIIQLVVEGLTYREIADNCFMAESSVKYHIKKFLRLCGAKSRNELVELLKKYYMD